MTTSIPLIRIVDDDPVVADSLRFYLEVSGFQVQAYESGEAFFERDDLNKTGCVLLDVRMPTMSGLEFQDIFIEKHTDLPIVFLSAHADISMAVEAVRKGASGFVTKPPKTDLLLDEIQKAVALHEDRKKMRKDLMEIEEQLSQLTPAEVETAQLIAKGLSNTEIASILGLAEVTVRRRRMDIGDKLDARNAVEVGELFRWRQTYQEALP